MTTHGWPQPTSHKTFEFGSIIIDSNFDSGNCSQVEKVNHSTFNIWIGTDHPKNTYRTWFHFSVKGFTKGTTITFNIKNMQNQSRLLLEGLVPVFRQETSQDWKRISQKINTTSIEYYQGWIQWQFKHTMTSNQKVFLAFFYPWSNSDNSRFLDKIQETLKERENIYFHRTCIIHSLEGRPIQFLTISSKKGISNKQQKIDDHYLFPKSQRPKSFVDKKGIVICARVHPGQVPGSHVMTGIIQSLSGDDVITKTLLDNFVFYIFPILNPDGVYRGHYRTDSNGINLNRYYINPSHNNHSPIYAAKKFIMHLHHANRFFAFLDLHAHAARKGTFIYGNSTNQLNKQIDACLFPKILSMNSQDFEYEGSNFTQKNMYCKDKADQISKQGSGRVAIYKVTKNANCWTLQCNYNCSRIHNILQPKRNESDKVDAFDQNQLNKDLIINYKYPLQKESTQFFTIGTYLKLGKEICQSFLDLIQSNPLSRIDNPKNYFKSVKVLFSINQNLKMNLGVALMRMAPNRFQSSFKKIYYGLSNNDNQENLQRSLKALYLMTIKKAKIQNINAFIKDKNDSVVIMPEKNKFQKRKAQSVKIKDNYHGQRNSIRITRVSGKSSSRDLLGQFLEKEKLLIQNDDAMSIESGIQSQQKTQQKDKQTQRNSLILEKKINVSKVILQIQDFRMIGIDNLRGSLNQNSFNKKNIKINHIRFKIQELPQVNTTKIRPSLCIATLSQQPRLRKGTSAKDYLNDL